MFSHVFLGTNDVETSRTFYDRTLGELGYGQGHQLPHGTAYRGDGGALVVARPSDGEPATASNGHTLGLSAKSYDEVDRWHKAGLEAGGKDEGAPGFRARSPGNQYGAYLRDPDGHKLCRYAPNVGDR